MSSCFCSSHVFIMCLTCNSLTLVSALVPCSTSVFKSTLQPVNLTLHFTFSENCLNLKSGYLHKTAIKSLLQSCLCLFSTCECSPGCVQGCISRWLNVRNIQSLSLCPWNTALPCGVELWLVAVWLKINGEKSVSLYGGYEYPSRALCMGACCIIFSPWRVLWQSKTYALYHAYSTRGTEKS